MKPRDATQFPVLLRKIDEAAQMLNCGRSSIYELIDAGRLELVKLGRSTRITDRSVRRLVDELVEERKVNAI
jgi:excisionase family DNA binding protein